MIILFGLAKNPEEGQSVEVNPTATNPEQGIRKNKIEDFDVLKGKFVIAGTGSLQLINESAEYIDKIKSYLIALLGDAKTMHGANKVAVISGMAEGFDEFIALAAVEADVPFIAAVPNKGYVQHYWSAPKQGKPRSGSRTGMNRMPQVTSLLNKAVEVVYVCASLVSNMPKYGGRFGSANLERNEWMVDRASLVWAYNPNKDIGTQHCVGYCKQARIPVFDIVVDNEDGGGVKLQRPTTMRMGQM